MDLGGIWFNHESILVVIIARIPETYTNSVVVAWDISKLKTRFTGLNQHLSYV